MAHLMTAVSVILRASIVAEMFWSAVKLVRLVSRKQQMYFQEGL